MNEVLKEVLLISSNGLRVTCVVIENLPKKFLFHKTKKLMPLEEYSDRLVPAFTIDLETGKNVPTGEMVDEILPGVTLDGAGSGGFIFDSFSDDAIQRLRAIEEHVNNTISDPAKRIQWVPYAQRPGDIQSAPRAYSTILRVSLPQPVSPSTALPAVGQVAGHPNLPAKKERKPMTEEHKAKLRDAARKAREAKLAKTQGV